MLESTGLTFISVMEAARKMGVHYSEINKLIAEKKVRAIRMTESSRWKIVESDFDSYLKNLLSEAGIEVK